MKSAGTWRYPKTPWDKLISQRRRETVELPFANARQQRYARFRDLI